MPKFLVVEYECCDRQWPHCDLFPAPGPVDSLFLKTEPPAAFFSPGIFKHARHKKWKKYALFECAKKFWKMLINHLKIRNEIASCWHVEGLYLSFLSGPIFIQQNRAMILFFSPPLPPCVSTCFVPCDPTPSRVLTPIVSYPRPITRCTGLTVRSTKPHSTSKWDHCYCSNSCAFRNPLCIRASF